MEQTKATYAMREDGMIDVLNTGIKNGIVVNIISWIFQYASMNIPTSHYI
jgi:hypothetical protein